MKVSSLSKCICGLALFGLLAGPVAAGAADSTSPAIPMAAPSLKDSLLPSPKTGGFAMAGFMLWCSSVIKVGDTYHLFASRWPAQYGMGGWTKYSECVRATASSLTGPYTFQEVVLQKRPDNWDKSRVHNVKIVRAGGKFLLFYINSANETGRGHGPTNRSSTPATPRSFRVRTAASTFSAGCATPPA